MRISKEYRLKKPESSLWMHFANFFAVLLWALAILDWKTGNSLGLFLLYASLLYCVALAVFCGEKEYERWHGYHRPEASGEAYVAIWTLLMAGLFFFGNTQGFPYIYTIPPEIVASYAVVIAFFAITEESKNLYSKKTP